MTEEPIWRYVEIDGKRYEFCDPKECILLDRSHGTTWCFHPLNKGAPCVEKRPCPARMIPNVNVCPSCKGTGVHDNMFDGIGAFRSTLEDTSCKKCKGMGRVFDDEALH